MRAIFQVLSQRLPRCPLWPVSATTIDHFNQAVLDLASGAPPVKVLSATRRRDDDLPCRRWTVAEVKARGHWKADASLRRYGEETRVLAELRKAPQRIIEYGAHVQLNFHLYLTGHVHALAPPIVGRPAPA